MTGKARILFVDDEKRVLNSMRGLFRREYELFLASEGAELSVALIAVPPYESEDAGRSPGGCACVCGKLNDTHDWFVQTPAAMFVSEGEVRRFLPTFDSARMLARGLHQRRREVPSTS